MESRPWLLRGVLLGVALAIAAVVYVSMDDDEAAPTVEAVPARIVTPAELAGVAAAAEHPVYWAGEIPGTRLEVTQESDGDVLLRYLTGGAEAGSPRLDFLTVGTYPLADPSAALDSAAAATGAFVRTAPDGRRLVSNRANPSSVYFVSPDNSVQVEVYDPSPARDVGLARSGRVTPVSAG